MFIFNGGFRSPDKFFNCSLAGLAGIDTTEKRKKTAVKFTTTNYAFTHTFPPNNKKINVG